MRKRMAQDVEKTIQTGETPQEGRPMEKSVGPMKPGSTFEPLDYFMVRVPAFPIDAYRVLTASPQPPSSVNNGEESLRVAEPLPPAALTVTHPKVRRALAVASLGLLDEIIRDSTEPRAVRRRESKVLRYLIRMTTRPTPFGLFSGVALGQWGTHTGLSLTTAEGKVYARVDMGWLTQLILDLEASTQVRPHLHWRANAAAYVRNERVILHEPLALEAGARRPSVSLRATTAVRLALELSRAPTPYSVLAAHLSTSIPGATPDKVTGLLDELCRQSLLISDLRPPLTGGVDPLSHVLAQLESAEIAVEALVPLRRHLARLQDMLQAWEVVAASLDSEIAYRAILDQIQQIAPLVNVLRLAATQVLDGTDGQERAGASSAARPSSEELANTSGGSPNASPSERVGAHQRDNDAALVDGERLSKASLVQVDMVAKLRDDTLPPSIAEETARLAQALLRLNPQRSGLPWLDDYRAAFLERYGLERVVPLLELLDPRYGLGAPASYAQDVTIAGAPRDQAAERERERRGRILADLATGALAAGQLVVELDEKMQSRIVGTSSQVEWLPSLDVCVSIAASSSEDVDAGRFQVVLSPGVGSLQAGKYFGRFAYALGPSAVETLRGSIRREQEQDADARYIWAEVVYQPWIPRWSNVSIRPALQPYEIVLGVTPGVMDDHVIPVDELVVGVRNGSFFLHWPRRQADVRLRAGHMLNPKGAPTIARFLDDLSYEGIAILRPFDWGAAEVLPFLPRLQVGRAVLSLARWRVTSNQRDRELRTTPPGAFTDTLSAWRARWHLPRHIYLSSDDNRLLLDLDDPHHQEELRLDLAALHDGQALLIEEAYPTPDQAWLPGPDGRYVSEFVIPLLRTVSAPSVPSRSPRHNQPPGDEARQKDLPALHAPAPLARQEYLRPTGSDWLFVKLYCGADAHDDLIAGPIRAFAAETLGGALARQWFFMRYADPAPHVRLRFHGDADVLLRVLMPRLCAWATSLLEDGILARFAFDTYDREVERYGGVDGIVLCERLFSVDSDTCAAVLSYLRQSETAPSPPEGAAAHIGRRHLAVVCADTILTALGLPPENRSIWRSRHEAERQGTGVLYRKHSKELRALLQDPQSVLGALPDSSEVAPHLRTSQEAWLRFGTQLLQLEARGLLTQPCATIAESLVHMHCNRMFGTDRNAEGEVIGLVIRTQDGLARG